jgi:hypothetical protein
MTRFKILVPIIVVVVLAGITIAVTSSNKQVAVTHVQKVSLDHKTYSNTKELKDESDLVIRGTVQGDGRTIAGPPLIAEDGQEVPSTPMTEFTVTALKVFKGSLSGDQITVVLTGGVAGDTRYEVEGMPWLSKQQNAIFYLHLGEDGKYYPMAGGAAIASKKPGSGNKFTLPAELTGASALEIDESTP